MKQNPIAINPSAKTNYLVHWHFQKMNFLKTTSDFTFILFMEENLQLLPFYLGLNHIWLIDLQNELF